jgi:Flp pilus assembly protein TadG
MKNMKLRSIGLYDRLCGDQSGQALIETAMSVSVLFMFLLGAAEFGRLAYVGQAVSNAAHAGAQYAAQGYAYATDSDNTSTQAGGIQTAARNEGGWVYTTNSSTFLTTSSLSFICSDDSAATGLNTDCKTSQLERIVTVTTSVQIQPLFRVFGRPTPFNVSTTAVQKVLLQ